MNKRLFCVDLLRGIDIFYLLVVMYCLLEPGIFAVWPIKEDSWSYVFFYHALTAFEAPGRASTWFGLEDFTQPLFIFTTGVSASLAMSRFITDNGVELRAFWKRLLQRTLMLWTLGSLLRGVLTFKLFTGYQPSFCLYSDTLHTIAVAYFAASVGLLIRDKRLRFGIGLGLPVIAAVIMATCGDYTQFGNAARLFEDYVYRSLGGKAKDFCYLLTTLTWAGMGILASFAGDVLKSGLAPWTKAKTLAKAGAVTLVVGLAISFFIPPIRYIYTISFVLDTLGLSTLLLAGLYVLTDIWNFRRGTGLLILFGQCSLVAWMSVNLFGDALYAAADRFVAGLPHLLGSDRYQPIFRSAMRATILIWIVWNWRILRSNRKNLKK